jgi:heptosyltransferase-2
VSEATLLVDTSFLGDVLCAEPLVRATKEQFPGPVDFLTSGGGAGMLAGHPALREIMVYDKRGAQKGLGGMLRMAKLLRGKGYARVFCSHRSWRTAMMLRLSRIPERVCFDNASGAILYTRQIPYPKELHEIQRNLALIGGGDWQRPRIFPTDSERTRAEQLTPQPGFVAVAPGSIWATKRWPEEHYATLVQQLVANGQRVVILGGPDDCALSARILELSARTFGLDPATFGLDPQSHGLNPSTFSESASPILDLCGKTNLRESYAVLERAACLVTNDSSPMHMGVAADIPVVAVFCSTIPAFGFSPRGPRDIVLEVDDLPCRPCGIHGHPTCPEKHFDCGKKTTPQMVMTAVAERL